MPSASGDDVMDFVTAVDEERGWPNLIPRDSATLIIVDSRESEWKVLMGRRHPQHVFMPGKFVFPGGRIEAADRRMTAVGTLRPRVEAALNARVARATKSLSRALALAAIRETFEETGVLIGTREHGRPERTPPGPWAAFLEHGVVPDLGEMTLVARAITPPNLRRRFDARFFAVRREAIAAEVQGKTGPDSELVELAWVSLEEAMRLDLSKITQVVLEDLRARLGEGFSQDGPVPFYHERRGKLFRGLL